MEPNTLFRLPSKRLFPPKTLPEEVTPAFGPPKQKRAAREPQEDESWATLPPELLSLMASGQDAVKSMRLVSHAWSFAFDHSVTGIKLVPRTCLWTPHPEFITNADGITVKSKFQCLRSITLHGCRLGPAAFSALQGSSVEQLTLRSCFGVTNALLKELQRLPRLAHLEIGWRELDKEGRSLISSLPQLKSLVIHSLVPCGMYEPPGASIYAILAQFSGRPLTKQAIPDAPTLLESALALLRGMPLTDLSLEGSMYMASAEEECILAGLPLTALNLNKTSFQAFQRLKGLPLQTLDLRGSDLDAAGLEALRGMPLKALSLSWEGVLAAEGPAVALLQSLPLTSLCVELSRWEGQETTNAVLRLAAFTRLEVYVVMCEVPVAEKSRLAEASVDVRYVDNV